MMQSKIRSVNKEIVLRSSVMPGDAIRNLFTNYAIESERCHEGSTMHLKINCIAIERDASKTQRCNPKFDR